MFDFDKVINRTGTGSYKWDGADAEFNAVKPLPLWIADMDFRCAPVITEHLHEVVDRGIYGYSIRTDSYYNSIIKWFEERDHWSIRKDELVFAPPGVIYGIAVLLDACTVPGDKVVMQVPNYDSLMSVAAGNGRELIENPLIERDGKYCFDFPGLERILQEKHPKVLLMDNPSNPTGRLWTREELEQLAELCFRYDVLIISDDIHSDIRPAGSVYTPVASLKDKYAFRSIVCTSTNKTFNLGGLGMGTFVIKDPVLRRLFEEKMMQYQTRLDNIFSMAALEAAYQSAGPWVDEMNAYVVENRKYFEKAIAGIGAGIRCCNMEATYFSWVDFSALGKGDELERFLLDECHLAFSPGREFGKDYSSFMRVNLACPRAILEEVVNRLKKNIMVSAQ